MEEESRAVSRRSGVEQRINGAGGDARDSAAAVTDATDDVAAYVTGAESTDATGTFATEDTTDGEARLEGTPEVALDRR